MIKTYYKYCDSATVTYRALRGDYCLHNRPTMQAIDKIGVVPNIERPVHLRFVRSAENIAIVTESIAENPNISILSLPQKLGLSCGTLWRILHLNLQLHIYKVPRNN